MKIFLLQLLLCLTVGLGSALAQQTSPIKNGTPSTLENATTQVKGLPFFLQEGEMNAEIARHYAAKYVADLPTENTNVQQAEAVLATYISTYYNLHQTGENKEVYAIIKKAKADLLPLIGFDAVYQLTRLGAFNYEK
jgi:hypothetical protein